ncbi:MAG: hypothetical protein HQK50_02635 [Oligoflexia bacterium]|nr:hypothetical protein [Oligoflexia bacterium]MBF0364437.1 hypothetical protein [Oligoflexia bacterium]
MNRKEFEKYFISFVPELYSFAFAIIPDDLQAEQVVIDACMVATVQEKSLINNILLMKNNDDYSRKERMQKLRVRLYKYVYKVASKRFYQLEDGIKKTLGEDLSGKTRVLRLTTEERAILHLHKERILPIDNLATILDLDEESFCLKLNLARNKLLKFMEQENPKLASEQLV